MAVKATRSVDECIRQASPHDDPQPLSYRPRYPARLPALFDEFRWQFESFIKGAPRSSSPGKLACREERPAPRRTVAPIWSKTERE